MSERMSGARSAQAKAMTDAQLGDRMLELSRAAGDSKLGTSVLLAMELMDMTGEIGPMTRNHTHAMLRDIRSMLDEVSFVLFEGERRIAEQGRTIARLRAALGAEVSDE
jgi:hypothetical protein